MGRTKNETFVDAFLLDFLLWQLIIFKLTAIISHIGMSCRLPNGKKWCITGFQLMHPTAVVVQQLVTLRNLITGVLLVYKRYMTWFVGANGFTRSTLDGVIITNGVVFFRSFGVLEIWWWHQLLKVSTWTACAKKISPSRILLILFL